MMSTGHLVRSEHDEKNGPTRGEHHSMAVDTLLGDHTAGRGRAIQQ